MRQDTITPATLRAAINSGELVVYYQSKHAVPNRQITGGEALVRWQHPEAGLIPPDAFIPLAEQTGLINDLELYVLDNVCQTIRMWLDAGLDVPTIAINMSALALTDMSRPDRIQACLEAYRLPASSLMVEVTESQIIGDMEQAQAVLTRLRGMGIDSALDDFGAGFANLARLNRLPVQQIKMDRSYLSGPDVVGPGGSALSIENIVDVAQSRGLSVLAEGVEHEAHLAYLDRIGCDKAQGYLFSRPMPASEFAAMLPPSAPQDKSNPTAFGPKSNNPGWTHMLRYAFVAASGSY